MYSLKILIYGLLIIDILDDSPALPWYFSGSETREYAPDLRTPGYRCADYYRSDPPG
jgi:hypothetical protein